MTKTEKTAIMEWITALYTFGISGEKKREESLVALRLLSQDGWMDRLASMKQETFERHFSDEVAQVADLPAAKLHHRFLTAYRRLLTAYETEASLFWTATSLIAVWPLLSRSLLKRIDDPVS
jgi:hypothetical protein